MPENTDLPHLGTHGVGDEGIALVKLIVSRPQTQGGLGCLFREIATADVGIDGHIELVEDSDGGPVVTGRLVSVQVKSGPSYFENEDADAWKVYIPKKTVNYWKAHSLPVILVLANLHEKQCFWVRADSEEHHELEKSYLLRVPKCSFLDKSAYADLQHISENTTESGRRLARLQGDLDLMRAIANGEAISVDLGVWINKSSRRTDVVVGYSRPEEDKGRPDGLVPITDFIIFGGGGDKSVVEDLFPWATVRVDSDFLETMEDRWYNEYLAATGTYDSEDGVYIDVLGTFDSSQYYDEDDPAPYAGASGEVEYYRYSLDLNDLGRGFLAVAEFLGTET
jgi:hypothetical protein